MLQANGTEERIRVWRSQRDLVRASITVCTRRSEKDRAPAKGTDRRLVAQGYDRA